MAFEVRRSGVKEGRGVLSGVWRKKRVCGEKAGVGGGLEAGVGKSFLRTDGRLE